MNSLKRLTQAEAPIIYMYNAMKSVLAYCTLPMPLEYFVHLLVGLIHVIYNNENIWTCVIGIHYWVYDIDVVVIECRLSATIRFGIINGHLSLICKAPSCMTN